MVSLLLDAIAFGVAVGFEKMSRRWGGSERGVAGSDGFELAMEDTGDGSEFIGGGYEEVSFSYSEA